MTPSVAAVVPALDESGRIAALVDRLRTFDLAELVVVDGESRDGTGAVARERGATVIAAPRGRAAQMNAGAAAVRADVLWFLHADVEAPEGAVDALRRVLRDPAVVAGAFHTRTTDDPTPESSPAWLRLADLRQRRTRLPYGDQGLFVRTAVFRAVGGYDERLRMFEDVDLARRLWRHGRVEILDPPLRVSSRRFRARPLHSLVAMNLFPLAFRVGMDTHTLERWYGTPR